MYIFLTTIGPILLSLSRSNLDAWLIWSWSEGHMCLRHHNFVKNYGSPAKFSLVCDPLLLPLRRVTLLRVLCLLRICRNLIIIVTVLDFCNSCGTIPMYQHNWQQFFHIRESLLANVLNNLLLHLLLVLSSQTP